MHLKPTPCFLLGNLMTALLFIIPTKSNAQKNASFEIEITDCKTKEPIDHVNIINEAGILLTETNAAGKASVNAKVNEPLYLSKFGYEKQDVHLQQQKENICLKAKENTLKEVTVDDKKINLYDYLLELRDKNYPSFLDRDSTLNYAFQYASSSLTDGKMIDIANGNFEVTYKDHYTYPVKFLSFKGAQITDFNYQWDSLHFKEEDLKQIKYINLAEFMWMYNLMSKQLDFQWRRISPKEVKMDRTDAGEKIFTTYFKGKLSEKFYFDAGDSIEKIEFYRPSVFFKGNYDEKNCTFKCTVIYSKTYPRIATSYEETYEVKNTPLPYKVSFRIDVNNHPPATTIRSAKSGKFDYDIILTGAASFHHTKEMIEKGKKENYIVETK